MTSEAPEFRTKTLSPLSPLPVHPPEPANIPVLRNQIDPVFNLTSTHIAPTVPVQTMLDEAGAKPEEAIVHDDAASVHSDFSDAYKEEPAEHNVSKDTNGGEQADDVSDDYAMTFDSDGEEHTDSQDVSQAIIEPETKSLPVHPSDSVADLPLAVRNSPPASVPQVGSDSHQAHASHSSVQPTTDSTSANPLGSNAPPDALDTTAPSTHTYEDIANGGIDIQQLLDNITANAEKNDSKNAAAGTLPPSSNGLPLHASLPPRPNIPQKRPFQEDDQKFRAGPPGIPQSQNAYRPPGVPLIAAGAPGTSTDPRGGLPPPPSASFKGPSLSTSSPISPAAYPQNYNAPVGNPANSSVGAQDEVDDLDAKWGPEIQKIYDEFLEYERQNVTEGTWDRFPDGSRLFIGNLPSEKVTKRDLFHIFYRYGKLAQVSIKQAYGFIQYQDKAACRAALQQEQGSEVRGRKMHLEISKPQKNSRGAGGGAARTQDQRGGGSDRGGRQARQGGQGQGQYERAAPPMRQDEYNRTVRTRDDYRPGRSVTPPRAAYRGRDEYAPRGRDSYDPRDRRRSRSPQHGYYPEAERYRERSLSPRRREANEDAELAIPRREPGQVPDVQIILLDQLDRGFVSWVENEIRARGVRTEVMFLSPRLPLQAVIRRQILEGVHAVAKLDMRSQNSSKIPLQVFDRQGGADNVRFDEYQDLEPRIAAELVLRAKHTQVQPPPAPVYQPPPQQYPVSQPYQAPISAQAAPNLANLVGQLDNATLQQLLGSLNMPQQQHNAPATASNANIDLAGILGSIKAQAPPQQNYQAAYQAQPPVNYGGNPAMQPMLSNTPQPPPIQSQPQQSAQQVQNIMAQLARFRQ